MAHNYILRVTAGPEYDLNTHQIVPVNEKTPVTIESDACKVELNVRIQDYKGLPPNSPSTSPYFSLPPHAKNKDAYSIAFHFTPKSPINGNDLVFGNDFDHPIRDRLPPGFGTAFKIVKWMIDPGLDGDVYADQPYLYGPAASSVNILHVGGKAEPGDEGLVFVEGGDEMGESVRKEKGVPETDAGRKKHFLNEAKRKEWEFEKDVGYGCDFYNPYLDFNDFALRLPGFTLPIMKYWDGQGLRYVLKNRATGAILFVVVFSLYLREDVDEQGNVKEGVEVGKPFAMMAQGERERFEKGKGSVGDGEEVGNGEAEEKEKGEKKEEVNTSADDVD